MAQTNSEQHRAETELPYGEVDSSSASGNGTAFEGQDPNDDIEKITIPVDIRVEPPSSQVGYGGGCDKYHEVPNSDRQGYWDGTDNPSTNPSERMGDSSKYPDESHGSEVRNGVAHGIVAGNVASGAGVGDDADVSTETFLSYSQTGAPPPSQKDAFQSRQLTEHNGAVEDESSLGNPGGTAGEHHEKEGFVSKLMHKLPGHKDDNVGSVDKRGPLELPEDENKEKPGLASKIKNKIIPCHDKHFDEVNPEIFE